MKKRFVWKTTIVLALFLIPILSLAAQPTANLIIYDDALAANWQNWSWDTAVAFNANSPVHAGSNVMSVTHTAAWAGLSLQSNTPFSTADYNAVTFWIHGGTTGGHQLSLKLRDGSLAIIESPVAVTTTVIFVSPAVTFCSLRL